MADGGIVETGDICKAFALGSDFVMIGGMFGGVLESDSELIEKQFKSSELGALTCKIITKKFKSFYGMSSKYANNKFFGGFPKDSVKCSEGREVLIPYNGSIVDKLKDIKGGIASCCTYCGVKNIEDLSTNATIIKVNNTINRIFEKYETDLN